jgi:ABC-type glycerol-3-phosphate transport system substrate-binding protein
MINKRLGAAALATCAVLALSACNPAAERGSEEPAASQSAAFTKEVSGDLKISGFNPSDEVGQSRADYAKQQLAGVNIQLDTTSFDPQKFAAQAASGNVPDLLQMDRSVVATLADKDLIVPLDECYTVHGVTPDQQYYPSAIGDVTYDGKVFAVPQFFQPIALMANKRVLEDGGVTLDQLDTSKPDQIVTVAEKLQKQKGGNPSVVGFDLDLPGSAYMWFEVFGGGTNDETGRPTLDDPNNVKALAWMKQVMDAQGGFAKVKSFKDTWDVFGDKNQFVQDQVGVQAPSSGTSTCCPTPRTTSPWPRSRSRPSRVSPWPWPAAPPSPSRRRPRTSPRPAPGRSTPRRRPPGSRPGTPAPRRWRRRRPSTPACSPRLRWPTRRSARSSSSPAATRTSTRSSPPSTRCCQAT